MAASHTLPAQPANWQLSKQGVLVLHGFGIKIRMDCGAFLAEWGVGLRRYQVRLSRVEGHKLRRVILIGSEGYISLESLKFITEVGASFSMIDKRGKVLMVCSPVSPVTAKLRRAQSLALTNGTALHISRDYLIAEKLASQAALVRDMLHDPVTADMIEQFRAELPNAQSIESLRIIEAQAAKLYWGAWSDLPILWSRKDEKRVNERWKHFGSRISPLTHSPRLAVNPAGALLNFLYCLLENETRIAIVAMGMLPEIGLLHADAPRDSLVYDVMEVCRPTAVDAFVLNWLQTEPFRKVDWWEDRNGNCRMVTSLAIKLCETSDTWRRFVGPVVEMVAGELWRSVRSRISKTDRPLPTRLTQDHRREVKGSVVPAVAIPQPAHVCRDCGASLRRDRTRCSRCSKPLTRGNLLVGRKIAQSPNALTKRSVTMRQHKAAISNWTADLPASLTRDVYLNRIVPALAHVSLSRIRSTLGISEPYARWIKNGKRIPHARHWQALARLARITA